MEWGFVISSCQIRKLFGLPPAFTLLVFPMTYWSGLSLMYHYSVYVTSTFYTYMIYPLQVGARKPSSIFTVTQLLRPVVEQPRASYGLDACMMHNVCIGIRVCNEEPALIVHYDKVGVNSVI